MFGTNKTSPFGAVTKSSIFGNTSSSLFSAAVPSKPSSLFGNATNPTEKKSIFGLTGGLFGDGKSNLFTTPKTTTSSLFGGFGKDTNTLTTKPFSLSNPLKTDKTQVDNTAEERLKCQIYDVLFNKVLFKDWRDEIIVRWNQLQAAIGWGKLYYDSQMHFVHVLPDNEFCRLKGVGYCSIPKFKDEEDIICLVVDQTKEKCEEIRTVFLERLNQLCQNVVKTIQIKIIWNEKINENQCEIAISAILFDVNKKTKNIPGNQFLQILGINDVNSSLKSDLSVSAMYIRQKFDIKAYLETPLLGVDSRIWKQWIDRNPNSYILLPIVFCGIDELTNRVNTQRENTKRFNESVKRINEKISNTKIRMNNIKTTLAEQRLTVNTLGSRLLKACCDFYVSYKKGMPFIKLEDSLYKTLENVKSSLKNEILQDKIKFIKKSLHETNIIERCNDVESDIDENDKTKQMNQIVNMIKTQQVAIDSLIKKLSNTREKLVNLNV
ncbi:Nucleoporin p54 [Intoshia linei]|uniref:Nucleoporin p54 n=1 Tax=Intoshia linei TaxID=1819745 RepID=A0A177B6Q0_9BILA|nr:Nucleoporin p54 [Intoshia linei]